MDFPPETVEALAQHLRVIIGGYDDYFYLRFPNHKQWPDLDEKQKERWRIRARDILEVIANSLKIEAKKE